MINHTNHTGDVLMVERVRSATLGMRGQIVIPEDMRKDMGFQPGETLILIERENEIVLRKEKDVVQRLEEEERFWRAVSEYSAQGAWDADDKVWDDFAKKELKRK